MERKTLALVLGIIPLIAVIVALAIAFAMTGDAQAMVLETGPEEVISEYLTEFTVNGGDLLDISSYSISDDRETIFLKITVVNPIDQTLLINSMSYPTKIKEIPITLILNEPTEILPESSSEIILTAELPEQNMPAAIINMPDEPDPSEINSEISFSGIIIKNNGGVQ